MDEFSNVLSRIGENLKELRKLNEWTQTELAEKSKRPQSSIARVESATYGDASLSLLYDLCNTLGISLAEVLAVSDGSKKRHLTERPKKVRLHTKWERAQNRVGKLSETEKDWVSDIINAAIGKGGN